MRLLFIFILFINCCLIFHFVHFCSFFLPFLSFYVHFSSYFFLHIKQKFLCGFPMITIQVPSTHNREFHDYEELKNHLPLCKIVSLEFQLSRLKKKGRRFGICRNCADDPDNLMLTSRIHVDYIYILFQALIAL